MESDAFTSMKQCSAKLHNALRRTARASILINERKNLPSASGFFRLMRCPGSFTLEQDIQQLTPEPEVADESREAGELIHAALAGSGTARLKLNAEQVALLERCRDGDVEVSRQHIDINRPFATYREQRFWLLDEELRPAMSGQFDVCRIQELEAGNGVAVCVDYKTGWEGTDAAEDNAQGMVLAVLVAEHFDVPRVIVGIVQPNAWPKVSVCEYGPEDLLKAKTLIFETLKKAKEPNAPRVAREHCKFCAAKLRCPEFQGRALAVEIYGVPEAVATKGQLLAMYGHWKTIQSMGEKLEAHLKRVLKEDPEAFGGELKLVPGAKRPVVDTGAAWEALQKTFTPAEFVQFCKVAIGPMRAHYRAKEIESGRKCTNDQAIKEIDTLLGSAVEYRQNESSLEAQ